MELLFFFSLWVCCWFEGKGGILFGMVRVYRMVVYHGFITLMRVFCSFDPHTFISSVKAHKVVGNGWMMLMSIAI